MEEVISQSTPTPPPWLASPEPQPDPAFQAAPPVVGPSADDPWAQAPRAERPSAAPQRRSLGLPIVGLIVGLFVVGAILSVAVPIYLDASRPPPPPVEVITPWNPGTGPLVQGLRVEGGMPESVRWSPDAKQVAWTTFDSEKNLPVVWLVGIGQAGFSGLQRLDQEPSWMHDAPPSVVKARVQGNMVALHWAGGAVGGQTAGVVDLQGLLGLVEPQSPAVITQGNQTLLAVAARLPVEGAAPTLHVFDVTSLIQRAGQRQP